MCVCFVCADDENGISSHVKCYYGESSTGIVHRFSHILHDDDVIKVGSGMYLYAVHVVFLFISLLSSGVRFL